MSQGFCVVFSYMWLTIRTSHILNLFQCNCHSLEKLFFPQNICSCHCSIHAAAEQSCLSDASQIPDLFPELCFGHRISFRSRKAFTALWQVISWARQTQNISARDRIPHTADYTCVNGEMSAWEVTQKTPSKGKVTAKIKSSHSVIKAPWSRNVRGFGWVFSYHCSSCLYLNTC